jgi:drug/metabolite transporter (DMT)-like permease
MAVLLAAIAGASFGALTVAVRWGLHRSADAEVGALAATAVGVAASAAMAAPSAASYRFDVAALWPFVAAGAIAPGASQIALTLAVRHAGASRTAIFMGTAPLVSIVVAWTLLDEPFRPALVVATVLIVLGSGILASERTRPAHFRVGGALLALLCAVLFAARDNIVRWAALDEHPPPLVAATTSLIAAAAVIAVYLALVRPSRLRRHLLQAVPVFAPAGLALALGYGTLLAALDRGRVSIVSPLNATGSLWAVFLAAIVIGRTERIGRATVLAALIVVAGGILVGALR